MASVWNVVQSANYPSIPASRNDENSSVESPIPDKFKQKLTVNSLRMSFRKRIPLKRINVNGSSPDYYGNEERKQKAENAKKKETVSRMNKTTKVRGITVESSMKKTFYRVTEQLTGGAKKSQLKETPQKSTPRTRYRERLMSPPDTPASPTNPLDSPCCSTPLGKVKTLKRHMRTQLHGNGTRKTPRNSAQKERRPDSGDFSRHLELISCGIQHLEANGNKMLAAISNIGLDYESSPVQSKMKSHTRLWKDEMKRYTPLDNARETQYASTKKNAHSQPPIASGMLRRTMTRMSLRAKSRPSTLRSTRSASNIESICYDGPMVQQKKLAPLREYVVFSK